MKLIYRIEERWFQVGDRVEHLPDGAIGTISYVMGIWGGEETRLYEVTWDDALRNADLIGRCIKAINLKKLEDTSLK